MYLTTGASSTSESSSVAAARRAVLEVDLEVVELRHLLQVGAARLDELRDRRAELVVLDDQRLGHEVGLEPDFLERLQVGRVGDRDEQPVAALVTAEGRAASLPS